MSFPSQCIEQEVLIGTDTLKKEKRGGVELKIDFHRIRRYACLVYTQRGEENTRVVVRFKR